MKLRQLLLVPVLSVVAATMLIPLSEATTTLATFQTSLSPIRRGHLSKEEMAERVNKVIELVSRRHL